MLHSVLIVLHAAAGVLCFAAGLLCIPLRAVGSWRFRIYAGSLVAMLGFVIGSIAYSWVDLDVATRLIFTGLVALGVYMVWRASRAYVRLTRQDLGWQPKYLDDIGFTLISLFDGFVIVGAIDLGMPVWLVVLAAVTGVAIGIKAVNRVKTRLVARRLAAPATGGAKSVPAPGQEGISRDGPCQHPAARDATSAQRMGNPPERYGETALTWRRIATWFGPPGTSSSASSITVNPNRS
jgi:hypothetical protein